MAGVQALFSNHWLLLAGWVHYLAFDLFIGSWQVRDAREHQIPHWAVVPGLDFDFCVRPCWPTPILRDSGAENRNAEIGLGFSAVEMMERLKGRYGQSSRSADQPVAKVVPNTQQEKHSSRLTPLRLGMQLTTATSRPL